MFRACDLVLVNKIDLLPHLNVDLGRLLYHVDAVHPGVEHIELSATTGEGVERWRDWLMRAATREGAAV
jgi:hydrogenase nickel incorporation protein HypB